MADSNGPSESPTTQVQLSLIKAENDALKNQICALEATFSDHDALQAAALLKDQQDLQALREENQKLQQDLSKITGSRLWKMVAPLQKFRQRLRPS